MDEIANGIQEQNNTKKPRGKYAIAFARYKRKILSHVWAVRLFMLAIVFFLFIALVAALPAIVTRMGAGRYLNLASNFIFTPKDKIKSVDGRTNILILGKGGGSHEAPDLTDTMIFTSVKLDSPEIDLISLPRDIWLSDLRAKLNSAYYWGNKKAEGGGIILAKASVEEILGKPIQYAVVVDFAGLTKIIDALGGIDVDVQTAFTDPHFPIPGREADLCGGDFTYACRYESITFEKGITHMDGETTLKFVRSRYAEGDEGTDLARAARQQLVIDAALKKVFTREILFSPSKIKQLIALSGETVETDIDDTVGAILARKFMQGRSARTSHVIGEDLLENPPIGPKYDNLYVFIPKGGNWDLIHEWVNQILSSER